MSLLKSQLRKKIPLLQKEIKDLIAEKGDQKISDVTVAQAYSGMRGIKAFVCDTSSSAVFWYSISVASVCSIGKDPILAFINSVG